MHRADGTTGGLAGRVAAVTGATSGSGRAIASRFAQEGATVVMLARGSERLEELETTVGGDVVGIPTDIGDPDSVDAAFAEIKRRYGKLDVLVNNAAVYRPCPIEELSNEDILAQTRTNFLGPVYTCRAAIPLLRAAGGGDIVNTSSETTIDPFPHLSMYSSTKAALETFSRMLMAELPDDDIRVTTLVQGVALGEGGGSTDWSWDPDRAEQATALWERQGYLARVSGTQGGQSVEAVADVHVYVVTRPRGQKLDTIHVRSY
ncbi:MAG TPA: SDR family oxidoreductase [Acidimicrobiales bacterium]|nr:SDR family oxidoreductase [Acidimicrobiales bacterium]